MSHPVYAMWSHPRSMSTAIERIMRERGDLDCAHEPFMYDYYVSRSNEMPHFDVDPDHPKTYAGIRDMLLERAESGPVFIKDMSYYVMPHILDDAGFAERLVNIFLVRRPRAAMISYNKIDPNVTSDEIGILAQWRHFQGLQERGGKAVVIRSEDVRNDPQGVIGAMWAKVGLPPAEHAFDWRRRDVPEDWKQVSGWHGNVLQSKGIAPMDPDAEQKEAETFEALCKTAPQFTSFLETHMPAYDALSAFALKPE